MTRRIIAVTVLPLFTLLAGCGNSQDIVVKTDLNEEVVIKDSAVSMLDFDWEQAVESTQEKLDFFIEEVQKIDSEVEDCGATLVGLDRCKEIYSESTNMAAGFKEKAKSNLETLNKFSEVEEPFKQVRYRPIFVDVNGDKRAMSYVTLTCLNPRQTAEENAPLLVAIKESVEDVELDKAYYSAGLEVCKKYAFKDTKVFAYRLSDDESEVKS